MAKAANGKKFMEEIWKDIPEYQGYYQVSNKGNVRSLDRRIVRKDGVVQFLPGKIMIPYDNTDGYLTVHLSQNGKNHRISVHRLVAEAFIPHEKGQEVNHKDFDRHNNCVENLEWITHGDNVRYTIKAGRHYCNNNLYGNNNPNYGNHILHDIYSSNPEYAKEKLARPNSQNGRAKAIRMYIDDQFFDFGCIKECAEYLYEAMDKTISVCTLRYKIPYCLKHNMTLNGKYRFSSI